MLWPVAMQWRGGGSKTPNRQCIHIGGNFILPVTPKGSAHNSAWSKLIFTSQQVAYCTIPPPMLIEGCGISIFVENHEAQTLLGAIIIPFIPSSVHFYSSRLLQCIFWTHTSSQVCTEGSKDPNHQCINIALILCFNQLHCYVGGKQGPQLSVQMNIPCCRLCCIVQCHTHITPVAPSCTKLSTTQCRGFVDFLEIKCDRKWKTWWLPGDL